MGVLAAVGGLCHAAERLIRPSGGGSRRRRETREREEPVGIEIQKHFFEDRADVLDDLTGFWPTTFVSGPSPGLDATR